MADSGAPDGNNNYKKGAIFNDALRRAITQDDGKRIRAAAEKLLDLAAEGTPWAVRELADRTDGKAAMAVTLANPDGEEFKTVTRIENVIIDGNTKG